MQLLQRPASHSCQTIADATWDQSLIAISGPPSRVTPKHVLALASVSKMCAAECDSEHAPLETQLQAGSICVEAEASSGHEVYLRDGSPAGLCIIALEQLREKTQAQRPGGSLLPLVDVMPRTLHWSRSRGRGCTTSAG